MTRHSTTAMQPPWPGPSLACTRQEFFKSNLAKPNVEERIYVSLLSPILISGSFLKARMYKLCFIKTRQNVLLNDALPEPLRDLPSAKRRDLQRFCFYPQAFFGA